MATLDCEIAGTDATCSWVMSAGEFAALDPQYSRSYVIEQTTNLGSAGYASEELEGSTVIANITAPCDSDAAHVFIFHLRDAWSGADFAGNVEALAACPFVPPDEPEPLTPLAEFSLYLSFFFLLWIVYYVGKMIVKAVTKFV